MGYELTRFIGEVDEEFQCSICKMILENPVQTPCEHTFCSECIKNVWQRNETDTNCPDCGSLRGPLGFDDLKPVARYFRNLLDKLKIKCDFYPDGCESVVKLESLPHHLNSCEYSSKSETFWDNGTNTEMGRRGERISCISHLVKQLTNRVKSRQDKTIDQEKYVESVINRQTELLSSQEDEITRLNDEVSRLRLRQQNDIPVNAPTEWTRQWQKIVNMKISIDKPNIFEGASSDNGASAQLLYPLEPRKKSFKVQILEQGVIVIGLTSTDHPIHKSMSTTIGYYEDSIGYRSAGSITVDEEETKVGRNWQVGDTIECGIKFPKNFVNDGNQIVTVYFTKNGQLVIEVLIKMPRENFYPTILIDFASGKVKYLTD